MAKTKHKQHSPSADDAGTPNAPHEADESSPENQEGYTGDYLASGEDGESKKAFYHTMDGISGHSTESDRIFSEETKQQNEHLHDFYSKAHDQAESAEEREKIRNEYREEHQRSRESTENRARISTNVKMLAIKGAVVVAGGLALAGAAFASRKFTKS